MKRVKINHPDAKEIFLNAIHDNQVIAYPTDTIYGLGTAMNNDEGIQRINLMKMRKQPMSIALGSFCIIKNQMRHIRFACCIHISHWRRRRPEGRKSTRY